MALWAPVTLYLTKMPPSYRSGLSLILPGSGAAASVNLDRIGQASSSASSPYASSSVSPTETYKRLIGAERILAAAAQSLGLEPEEFGKPRVELVDLTGLIHVSMTGPSAEAARDRAAALLAAGLNGARPSGPATPNSGPSAGNAARRSSQDRNTDASSSVMSAKGRTPRRAQAVLLPPKGVRTMNSTGSRSVRSRSVARALQASPIRSPARHCRISSASIARRSSAPRSGWVRMAHRTARIAAAGTISARTRVATPSASNTSGGTAPDTRERHIPFRDNDRPGILLAGALRAYANRWGVTAQRRAADPVAVFAANDDGHRTAQQLAAKGVPVLGVIDPREDAPNFGGYETFAGATVTGTKGRHGLTAIQITRNGRSDWHGCGVLGVSGGWNPNVHLASHHPIMGNGCHGA
ncbi:hypothetical protein [Mangrovicoccus ximenensis]|uniref:hypothetical protein n=1 Tax=Mangrovicoccus ximenensis TaxID=1911570 RepID=UPI00191BDF40